MLRALWNDEAGFVITSELLLIVTIMVIGLIVGFVVVRDAVVQELGDVAAAIGALDQSYSYFGTQKSCVTSPAFTAGGEFTDIADVCDPQPDNSPNGVLITLTPAPET